MQQPVGLRVHILGASGSGTTTLGRALAAHIDGAHFDTDDFYWTPSDPPFQHKREISDRLRILGIALDAASISTLSGSLAGWGDPLVARFTHVVFIALAPSLRLARLRARERARYGDERIAPGGDLFDAHRAFMSWAEGYDRAGTEQRSRTVHEQWLARLPASVRVLRVDGAASVDALVAETAAFLTR